VFFPIALPDLLTGIRIGPGSRWSSLVAAEFVAAKRRLGVIVQSAARSLVTEIVLMGILIIAAEAFALEFLIRFARRVLVP
jgi:taurine transport system permease protein